MKKYKIVLALLFISIILILGGVFYFFEIEKDKNIEDNIVSLGSCDINIEAVSTEELMKKGLSDRDSLCENCGMLFVFGEEEHHFFWMKDMRFPIDIIWLRDNKVVDISQDISHKSKNSHSSKEKVDKVLELNANAVTRCEIEIGDKLKD
ncbi:MAG: DUF192 domain-containing protein [Candidatus Moranbacteria bacterium]|jgi:uncharacterized membrane protein (UPF0127 family)|nr:DUF192 domain-containing protein [Candidatus Moranbacteria bacterium]